MCKRSSHNPSTKIKKEKITRLEIGIEKVFGLKTDLPSSGGSYPRLN